MALVLLLACAAPAGACPDGTAWKAEALCLHCMTATILTGLPDAN